MSTPIVLTIYGADADYTGSETPDITQAYFTGLTGLTSVTLNCYDLGAGIALESEETEYADNRVYVDKSFFGVYKVKILYRNYPASTSSLATYMPEIAVCKKPYTWLYSTNYNIGFATANLARAVNLTAWSENKFHDLMSLELEFKHRKPE